LGRCFGPPNRQLDLAGSDPKSIWDSRPFFPFHLKTSFIFSNLFIPKITLIKIVRPLLIDMRGLSVQMLLLGVGGAEWIRAHPLPAVPTKTGTTVTLLRTLPGRFQNSGLFGAHFFLLDDFFFADTAGFLEQPWQGRSEHAPTYQHTFWSFGQFVLITFVIFFPFFLQTSKSDRLKKEFLKLSPPFIFWREKQKKELCFCSLLFKFIAKKNLPVNNNIIHRPAADIAFC